MPAAHAGQAVPGRVQVVEVVHPQLDELGPGEVEPRLVDERGHAAPQPGRVARRAVRPARHAQAQHLVRVPPALRVAQVGLEVALLDVAGRRVPAQLGVAQRVGRRQVLGAGQRPGGTGRDLDEGRAAAAPALLGHGQRDGVARALHVVHVDLVPRVRVGQRHAHLGLHRQGRGGGRAQPRQPVHQAGHPVRPERPGGVQVGDEAARRLLPQARAQVLRALALVEEGPAEAPVPPFEAEGAPDQRPPRLLEQRRVGIVHVQLRAGRDLPLQRHRADVVVDRVVLVAHPLLAVHRDDLGVLEHVAPPERDLPLDLRGLVLHLDEVGGALAAQRVVAVVDERVRRVLLQHARGRVGVGGSHERVPAREQGADRAVEGPARRAEARREGARVGQEEHAVPVVHEGAGQRGRVHHRPVHRAVVGPAHRGAAALVVVVEPHDLQVRDALARLVVDRRVGVALVDAQREGARIDALTADLVEVPQLQLTHRVEGRQRRVGLEVQLGRVRHQLAGGRAQQLHLHRRHAAGVLDLAGAAHLQVVAHAGAARVHGARPVGRGQALLAAHLAHQADDLEVGAVDVAQDLVVAVRARLELGELAEHRVVRVGRRGGARRQVRPRPSAHRGQVRGVVGVVAVQGDAGLVDVEGRPARVVEQEVDAADVVEVGQRLRGGGRPAGVARALALALLLAGQHREVERPVAQRGLDAEQALVAAAVGHVLRAGQRQVRVAEVERLHQVVLVALVVDGDAVGERDLVGGVLQQVDLDAVGELALEPDVEVLLHVQGREQRAPLAQQARLPVGPVARPRQPDVLGARHVQRRPAGTEPALHPGRQRRGQLERQPGRGRARRRPGPGVDVLQGARPPLAFERQPRRFAREDGQGARRSGFQRHVPDEGRGAQQPGIGGHRHPQGAGVEAQQDPGAAQPHRAQGPEHEAVLEGEPGGRAPGRGQRVSRGHGPTGLQPEVGKPDEDEQGR